MKENKRHEEILKELENTYNLSREEVLEIINSPFSFIRGITKNLNFETVDTEDELNSLKTNFNIPRIGKLYANIYNIKRIHNVRKNKRHNPKKGE